MFVPDIRSVALTPTGPLTAEHSLLDDGDIQVGVWSASPGTFSDSTGDCDEVMLMVGGRATVVHSQATFALAADVLWSTPRDWDSEWTVHEEVRKMYVIDNRPGGPAQAEYLTDASVVDLGVAVRRPVVLDGDPCERSLDVSVHNRLDAGVWDCTPGSFPFRRDGYDEVFCILSGRATLTVDGGEAYDLRPGAMLVTPAGTTGRWDVHEHVRKAYVMILGRG